MVAILSKFPYLEGKAIMPLKCPHRGVETSRAYITLCKQWPETGHGRLVCVHFLPLHFLCGILVYLFKNYKKSKGKI